MLKTPLNLDLLAVKRAKTSAVNVKKNKNVKWENNAA